MAEKGITCVWLNLSSKCGCSSPEIGPLAPPTLFGSALPPELQCFISDSQLTRDATLHLGPGDRGQEQPSPELHLPVYLQHPHRTPHRAGPRIGGRARARYREPASSC
ncbi:hypothetical protein SKAU_G00241590 [Synaphobranchus kaupii]|uniref:Uncharacterized protein n=1 Tax=Synaphobranchus kaupii TaxID=118154 RepID=A0A9Q1F7T8_SYNKA|nr:hypothetical protein SKAU_G00241590 [Synaphobranchus kaupii]